MFLAVAILASKIKRSKAKTAFEQHSRRKPICAISQLSLNPMDVHSLVKKDATGPPSPLDSGGSFVAFFMLKPAELSCRARCLNVSTLRNAG